MRQRRKVVRSALRRLVGGGSAPVPLFTLLNTWRRGFGGWSYIYYELGKHGRFDDYLPDITMRDMIALNTGSGTLLLTNKLVFERVLGGLARVSPVLAVIGRGTLVPTSAPALRTAADLVDHCRSIGPLILKPIDGIQGRGVLRLSCGRASHSGMAAEGLVLNGHEIDRAELTQTLSGLDNYLVSEFAQQAGYAHAIFPEAANTMRIVTMIDPATHRPFIAASIHRFGVAASAPADNTSRGGVSCRVDPATGRLGPAAGYRPPELFWTSEHPETGATIEGVTVEHWQEVKDLVLGVAQAVPYAPYVGWDVLVCDDGPMLIEGNSNPSLHTQKHFPFLLDDRVRAFVEHHGVWRDSSRRRARMARQQPRARP